MRVPLLRAVGVLCLVLSVGAPWAAGEDGASSDATSRFQPREDAYHFPNHGTHLTPDGNASGMSLGAWEHRMCGLGGGQRLRKLSDGGDDDIWEDDFGLSQAAEIERAIDWKKFEHEVVPRLDRVTDSETLRRVRAAIEATGQPQLVVVRSSAQKRSQVLVAYAVRGKRILVWDPNVSVETVSAIELVEAAFRPYGALDRIGGAGWKGDWIRHVQADDVVDLYGLLSLPTYVRFPFLHVRIDDPEHGKQDLYTGYWHKHGNPVVVSSGTPVVEVTVGRTRKPIPKLVVRAWMNDRWYALGPDPELPKLEIKPGQRTRATLVLYTRADDGGLRWLGFRQALLGGGPWISWVHGRSTFAAEAASGGTILEIDGKGFGRTEGRVEIGGKRAEVARPAELTMKVWGRNLVYVYVPDDLTPGMHDVVLFDAAGLQSNARTMRVLPKGMTTRDRPKVKRVEPNSGAVMVVEGKLWSRPYIVYGDGFGMQQRDGKITIGGTEVKIMRWSQSFIQFQLTPEVQTGDLIVHAKGIHSEPIPFTVATVAQAIPNSTQIRLSMNIPVATEVEDTDKDGKSSSHEFTRFIAASLDIEDPEWAGTSFSKEIVEKKVHESRRIQHEGYEELRKIDHDRVVRVRGTLSADGLRLQALHYEVRETRTEKGEPSISQVIGIDESETIVFRVSVMGVATETAPVEGGGTSVRTQLEYSAGKDLGRYVTVRYDRIIHRPASTSREMAIGFDAEYAGDKHFELTVR